MINDKKVLAIIPARGGSKGVPGKNIRNLGGKPLIAWTIEEANKSVYIDRAVVSTDDEAIIKAAIAYGGDVPFSRPASLAQDDSSGISPVLHAIDQIPGYDYVVLLQPTSPLRNYNDIDKCIELLVASATTAVVSVTEQEKSPYWMFEVNQENKMKPVMGETIALPRQELPKVYALNGAVYVSSIEQLKQTETFLTKETVAYVMPSERSIDIDTLTDFRLCEILIESSASKTS
ncbi:cytidylyltransferase domain-containing protein [Paenibacillus sinopodophylli]|uniref:acylneuraminate cytidylyltransferase family protein n=1 Tax=Paenibacillus sinopodophylli TaxID=1837342 RepID=UPI00110D1DC0|nr:acylneuraminate cytidylyltransferase family protein [Paenibacillus sinopodophylli]